MAPIPRKVAVNDTPLLPETECHNQFPIAHPSPFLSLIMPIYVDLDKTIERRKYMAFFLPQEMLLNGKKIDVSGGGAGHSSLG